MTGRKRFLSRDSVLVSKRSSEEVIRQVVSDLRSQTLASLCTKCKLYTLQLKIGLVVGFQIGRHSGWRRMKKKEYGDRGRDKDTDTAAAERRAGRAFVCTHGRI